MQGSALFSNPQKPLKFRYWGTGGGTVLRDTCVAWFRTCNCLPEFEPWHHMPPLLILLGVALEVPEHHWLFMMVLTQQNPRNFISSYPAIELFIQFPEYHWKWHAKLLKHCSKNVGIIMPAWNQISFGLSNWLLEFILLQVNKTSTSFRDCQPLLQIIIIARDSIGQKEGPISNHQIRKKIHHLENYIPGSPLEKVHLGRSRQLLFTKNTVGLSFLSTCSCLFHPYENQRRQELHSHNPNNLDRFPEIKKKSGHLSLITHHQSPGTISSHWLGWGVGDAIHFPKKCLLGTQARNVTPEWQDIPPKWRLWAQVLPHWAQAQN